MAHGLEVVGFGLVAFVGAFLGVRYGLARFMPAVWESSTPVHRGRNQRVGEGT